MRTLHKLTHRPLALCALFVGLGVLGWHLPELGSAVFAYSSNVVKAARANITSTPTASQKVVAQPAPAAAKGATTTALATAVQQTPGQQAVAAARAALEAARAVAKNQTPQGNKQGDSAFEVALANYNAAVAQRLAEIRTKLGQLGAAGGTATTDSGAPAGPTPEYQSLLAEAESLGGFPETGNRPLANEVPEVEANNTSATATLLTGLNGTNQTVVIGTGGLPVNDQDFWRIDGAPAGSKIWAFIDTGGSSASRDSIMELRAADGTTIIEDDDDGASATNGGNTVLSTTASAIANRTLTAGGTFFLRVAHFSGATAITSYKLYVTITTTSSAEVESNDTSGLADNITPTATDRARVRTGSIGSGTDVDFYSVTVAANTTLYINADCDPERDGTDTDVIVDVVDTNGTTQILSIDGTPALFSVAPESEATSNLRVAAGTYFIRVRPFSATDTGTYALLVGLASPSAAQVCPPSPITSSLGVAGGNFAKTSGTMTQRLNRDGVVSACGVARTQNAPIAATRTFDKYTFSNTSGATVCVTVRLTVVEQAASNYMVGAFSTFVPTNLTSGWLGDPGLSSGIPPNVLTFGVNIAAGASFDVVVFNANATGDGNPYELNVFGLPGCVTPPCGIVCPANITTNVAAGTCAATVTYAAPTTTGVCNAVTCVPASGSSFAKGVTTVTCTSAGNSNGTQTCSFTVTVVDNIPPTLPQPADISVGTTGTSQVVTYTNPVGTDNCPGVGVTTCNPPSGSAFPLGTTTVTCSVTDAVNLTATTTFRVHVNRLTVGSLTDPLACTGPGNKVNGSFAVTNNSAVQQTVAATVALGPAAPIQALLALSCAASTGTCTIAANQASLTYTATLAAGASATVSYVLQVNDGVPPGTVLTSNVTASFNGGPNVTAGATTQVNCALPGPGAPFINAAERTVMSDQRAGSVLFYPIYASDASGGTTQNARLSLTNTSDKLGTFVHLFFVDGASCSVSDAFVCLTPNQTTTFLASDLDPGTRGYLVAVATDANGCPRHFNYLIGDEFVKFSTGHAANLGAEAVPAIAGSPLWVSCDGSAPTATLRFNSVDYGAVPYTLAADSIGSIADGNNTLLVVNRIGGDLQTGPSRLVPLFGTLYDDAEISYSFNLPTNNLCQYAASLTDSVPRTTPRLSTIIPAGRTGWFKLAGTSEIGIFGATINFNPNVASSSGAFNGGHNLHKITFTNAMTYTIPIFPPTC